MSEFTKIKNKKPGEQEVSNGKKAKRLNYKGKGG
jgi:hypothetical protein